MELKVEKSGDIAIVGVSGDRLDTTNIKEFMRDIAPILEANPKLVLDISKVEFVDSSGLGAFLFCLKRSNTAGGDLKVCGMTKAIRVLFELVRFHRIIEIYGSKEEAVKAFQK
jgi:anti-sigma B factor antagonist